MRGWEFLAPQGVLKLLQARREFERLGLTGTRPWRAALSRHWRTLLVASRLDHVPARLLRSPEVAVDVGANVGVWSEAVMTLIAPRQLIAIEPDPNAFHQLGQRLRRWSNVKLIPCAVGAASDQVPFRLMENSEWNSVLAVRAGVSDYYSPVKEARTILVELQPLDHLLANIPGITLLKVDIQGGELALLDGARQTLSRTQAIILETNFVSHYEGDALFNQLHERMTQEFGFYLHRWARPTYSRPDGEGRLLYADAIYISSSFNP